MGGWSFSQYKQFTTCPKKIGYRRKGVYEPYNPAMKRGNLLHKDAEDYLNGVHQKIPATLSNFKEEFDELRAKEAQAEVDVAVDEFWNPVAWKSKDAWLRYKVDARVEEEDGSTTVIDFKTGRIYMNDHEEQLELYALSEIRLHGTERVRGEAWYFDQDHIESYVDITQADVDEIEARWRQRAKALLSETEFRALPGKHCSWCGYNAARGGPCNEGT